MVAIVNIFQGFIVKILKYDFLGSKPSLPTYLALGKLFQFIILTIRNTWKWSEECFVHGNGNFKFIKYDHLKITSTKSHGSWNLKSISEQFSLLIFELTGIRNKWTLWIQSILINLSCTSICGYTLINLLVQTSQCQVSQTYLMIQITRR